MPGQPMRAERRTEVRTEAEHLAERLAEIEAGVLRDDPAFVRRLRRLQRAETVRVATVASLLVLTAILLTVALATQSAVAWFGGGAAFIASFAVDGLYRRRLEALTSEGRS